MQAQTKIYIHMTDGSVEEHYVADVDSITFGEGETVPPQIDNVTVSAVTSSTAAISVTVSGDRNRLSEIGVAYSTDSTAIDLGSTESTAPTASQGTTTLVLRGLTPDTTYFAVAYIAEGSERTYSTDTLRFRTPTDNPLADYPMPEAVDLGLSVKWASWNVGAKSVYDYGLYICWGDTADAKRWYPNIGEYRYPETGDITGTQHDITHLKWGDGWQMPTVEQLEELRTQCTWVGKIIGGVTGWVVTSNANGNSIFLPEAGYYSALQNQERLLGTDTWYWTGQQGNAIDHAIAVNIIPSLACRTQNWSKTLGAPVRAVYIGNDTPSPTPTPIPTPEPTDTISGEQVPLSPSAGQAVDLGLSVKWANCNLGATSPRETGGYYAWGETATKEDFSLATYQYYVAEKDSMYTPEGLKQIAGTKYDAARMTWGGAWRLPSRDEVDELCASCTWTWDSNTGGYTVTGPNGNSIFLPVTGYKNGTETFNEFTSGIYWSGTNYDREERHRDIYSYKLQFSEGTVPEYSVADAKELGHVIRPVTERQGAGTLTAQRQTRTP